MNVSHSKRDTVEKLLLSSMMMNKTQQQHQQQQQQQSSSSISQPPPLQQLPSLSSPSSASLLFSIEQWELVRRLRNSGLTRDDVCLAYDELDRVERDLGTLYDMPMSKTTPQHPASVTAVAAFTKQAQIHHQQNQQQQQQQQQNELFAKNFQRLISQAASATTNSNSKSMVAIKNEPAVGHHHHHHEQSSGGFGTATTSGGGGGGGGSSAVMTQNANNLVNAYFAGVIDSETENKQIEEFRSKGEVAIHSEISFFVYKNDLKQSQIARMAGVNQAYVSKFLRGEFFDLSENGKTLIYKWYLRFLKHPAIYLKAHNITLTSNEHLSKSMAKLDAHEANPNSLSMASFTNVTNTSYDQPKRTRFSFKSEHLMILEKAFLENQYPDQKRREEIAKSCNEARPCAERERVTEQIITHWFQNKRKISRKANCEEQTTSPLNMSHMNGANMTHLMHNGGSSSASASANYGDDGEVIVAAGSSGRGGGVGGAMGGVGNDEDDEDDDEEEDDQLDYQNSCSPLTYQDYLGATTANGNGGQTGGSGSAGQLGQHGGQASSHHNQHHHSHHMNAVHHQHQLVKANDSENNDEDDNEDDEDDDEDVDEIDTDQINFEA